MDTGAADGSAIAEPPQDISTSGVQATAWIALQNSVTNLASLVVFIVLSRLLLPKAFGLVAAASVVVLFFRILVDAGFSRRLIQRTDLSDDIVDTAFWSAFATGIVLTGAVLLAAPLVARMFHEPGLTSIVRALSCVLLVASLDRTQSALLDRRMAFKVQAIRSTVAASISAGAAIGAAFAGLGVWSLVVQTISLEVVNLVLLWTLSGWYPRFRYTVRQVPELLSFGVRYMGIQVMGYLNQNADNFLIGIFLGAVPLGYYVVAYRVLIVLNEIMIVTVNRVGLAAFSRLQGDEAELRESAYSVAGLSATIALPVYAGLAVIAPEAVHLVFGARWALSAPVMRILCIAGTAQTVTSFTHPLVIAVGRVRNELRWQITSMVVQVAGFAAAVHLGLVAVAWSLAVSSFLFVPVRVALLGRWVGTSARRFAAGVVGPVVATGVMIGVVLLARTQLANVELVARVVVEVAVGAVGYLGCLVIVDRDGAKRLTSVARKLSR